VKLDLAWLKEPGRIALKKFLEDNIARQMRSFGNPALYESEDESTLYKLAISGGQLSCYQLLYYLLIDQSVKPAIAREDVSESLNTAQFKEYVKKVLQRFTHRPPATTYSGGVYNQTIINLLSKLEISDGT
jgi:hypothetical protein